MNETLQTLCEVPSGTTVAGSIGVFGHLVVPTSHCCRSTLILQKTKILPTAEGSDYVNMGG